MKYTTAYLVPAGDNVNGTWRGEGVYEPPTNGFVTSTFRYRNNKASINFGGTYTPQPALDVRLNFGRPVDELAPPAELAIAIRVPSPTFHMGVLYDSNVSRPLTWDGEVGWEVGSASEHGAGSMWQTTKSQKETTDSPWAPCNQLQRDVDSLHQVMDTLRVESKAPWEVASRLNGDLIDSLYVVLERFDQVKLNPWGIGEPIALFQGEGFVQLLPLKHHKLMAWEESEYLTRMSGLPSNVAEKFPQVWVLPWQDGVHLRPGLEKSPPKPVEPPFIPSHTLNFVCKYKPVPPLEVMLNFGLHPCPEKGLEIVARKVYFIVNTISLKRVSDNEPIEILGASVGIDKSSWAWSFSGSLPYSQLEKVEPSASGPVEVELEINSIKWRFLVEEYDENKQFAKTAISIRGRSLTAYLDSPYAPTRSFIQNSQITSRQFAEAELTRPGLITGFDFDWMFPDELGWDMPAGTWSYNNLTPLEVINQIVQGAGGYVNSHRLNKTLIVRPEYPVPFWEWEGSTPDKILPKTLIRSQNLRWAEKPLYNGVYVTGENTGVTALVRKLGTLGDFQAPSFTGAMISSNLAARMKGISILSAGGKQATVGLELPMEQSVGLLTPGMLIEVTNGGYGTEAAWRGLIRSTSIEARRTNQSLTVSQSVDLERHYGGF